MASWPVVLHGRYLSREDVLSVATHGFIGCYGAGCGTDMESLCWRGETGVHARRHPSLHCPF